MKFRLSEESVSIEEINEIENSLGISLPQSYREIMSQYNGGYPEKEFFRGATVLFLSFKYGGPLQIEPKIYKLKDFFPEGFFPFCSYQSAFACISLNEDDYGKIFAIEETGDIELLCDSFDEFLEELSDDSDY